MPFQEAQQALLRVPGVVDCILSAEARKPVEVHLVAASGSDRQQVILAAMTVLARLGLEIEEEQLHVTVERYPQAPELVIEELEHEVRAHLLSWNLQVNEEQTLAEVELRHADAVVLGRASLRGAGQAPELLARACLDALEILVGGRVALRLVGFTRSRVGEHDLVSVVLQETAGRSERLLAGAALCGEETARAGAYAVLDAMNRRLGVILSGPRRDYEID
jgi:hypothetical protein